MGRQTPWVLDQRQWDASPAGGAARPRVKSRTSDTGHTENKENNDKINYYQAY